MLKKYLILILFLSIINNIASRPILILMYHGISNKPGRYNVTPKKFREHLQKLSDNGYVTAKLEDVILNRDNIKNKKIVILRFDDSRKNQFKYIKNKNGKLIIDPNCAVGIILDFHKQNPSFGKHAIFCVIPNDEFHQPRFTKRKLNFLLDNGMEIGNHSFYHEDLTQAGIDDIDRNFGQAMAHWEKMLGTKKVQQIKILATPYGIVPVNNVARERLKNYQWQNKNYKSLGILYAAKNYNKICPDPATDEFDRFAIPSIEVNNENFDQILSDVSQKMV